MDHRRSVGHRRSTGSPISWSSTGLPAPLLVDVARAAIATAVEAGDAGSATARAHLGADLEQRRLLQPVINATGVLLHTNMGRAPLAVHRPAGYTNLELDLARGQRGDRSAHAARFLAKTGGAEAALIVNNGAAAIFLVLATLAAGREVIVSRGELVEIGGGFRIPDVLESSGARLVEVGTTNRTRLSDYQRRPRRALGPAAQGAPVQLPDHRLRGVRRGGRTGRTGRPGSSGRAGDRPRKGRTGGRGEIPVVVDLGSGLLDANCPWLEHGPPSWLADEPAVRQTLAAGASVVTFSCDKLLGGPQAGVIAGRADLVDRCRRHPLARALRPGGLVLESLQAVALAYLRGDAGQTVPLWQLATTPLDDLRRRAQALGTGQVVACESVMGGGALPGRTIPSIGVALAGDLTGAPARRDPPGGGPGGRRAYGLRPAYRLPRSGPGPRQSSGGMRVIATAGHVDHGKSTLVWALTGTDPDRWEAEKTRGMTIDLGFASTTLPSGREVGFVDVPGHGRFLKNMLAGVSEVDACLFVVAATEGWMAQSEEHLRILELFGLSHGVIALTKVGLVDEEVLELATLEIAERLEGTFLSGAETVGVDVPAGVGLDALRSALDRLVAATPAAVDRGRPRLWIDRSFPVRGAGTVVTGTLGGGRVSVGDELLVGPASQPVRVRGLQSHYHSLASAEPGRRLAVNLTGVGHQQVGRGHALVRPGQWQLTRTVDASLRGAALGRSSPRQPGSVRPVRRVWRLPGTGAGTGAGRPRHRTRAGGFRSPVVAWRRSRPSAPGGPLHPAGTGPG